jgi:LmbE family N-acetylglucosaminyl deacetylase
MSAFYIPKRAMAIVAHPDDLEFGAAGTVARWSQAGAEVCYVICTSGDVGIAASMSRDKAKEIRETEQRKAAEITGVKEVVFLREPDGTLVNTLELRKKLVREIRRFKPEVLITTDPTALFFDNYINHPDHRAAGMAALDAVFPAAGQPHVFEELAEEGLTAHKTKRVYVNSWRDANTWVNITDTIDIKIAALKAHESQMAENNLEPDKMLREWAARVGEGKEMEYAEAFRVIILEKDEDKNPDSNAH